MINKFNTNMNNTYTIREFQEIDLIFVNQLIYRVIDKCYSDVYSPIEIQFFKEFHSTEKIMQRSKDGTILVVEKDGCIIATGTIVRNVVLGVFVHPKFQYQGYGKSLMFEIERIAIKNGYKEVNLGVSLPAKKFYEDLGYEIVEKCEGNLGNEQYLNFWKAKKILTKRNQ